MQGLLGLAWFGARCFTHLQEIKQSPQQRMSAEGMDPNSMEAAQWCVGNLHRTRFGLQVLAIKHMARRPPEKSQSQTSRSRERYVALRCCGQV